MRSFHCNDYSRVDTGSKNCMGENIMTMDEAPLLCTSSVTFGLYILLENDALEHHTHPVTK